jgi:DNA-binding CsgD family transcriptional regulator
MSEQCSKVQEEQKAGICFTEREMQCLQQIMLGKNLLQTAENLNISRRSVYFYLQKVRKKLDFYI